MLLWQIRQFPDKRQDWLNRHSLSILLISSALLLATGWSLAQDGETSEAEAETTTSDAAAPATFAKALAAQESHQSIQATLHELVSISEQPVRMTGRYLEQAGKTRLELHVKLPGEVKGSLLEISDGEILWSQTEFREAKQVTLRNLKQIAEAFVDQPELLPAGEQPELGLGGLAGLMNSLNRTMDFDQQREETDGDLKLIVVQGKWKPDYAAQWRKNPEDDLPAYIPDLLRIYFDAETLFPRRFLYLKRHPEKSTFRPLVRLEFQEVQLDQPVDETVFQFTPPEDLVPDDVTQQYIDQLKRKHAPPGTDAAAAEKGPRP